MARRRKDPAPETPDQENGTPNTGPRSYADRLRDDADRLEDEVGQMRKVNDFIRSTIRGPGSPDEKDQRLMEGLYDMGLSDQQVSYAMEQKQGNDGNWYRGYTFSEVNAAERNLKAKRMQLTVMEGRGRHQAAEEAREASEPGQQQIG